MSLRSPDASTPGTIAFVSNYRFGVCGLGQSSPFFAPFGRHPDCLTNSLLPAGVAWGATVVLQIRGRTMLSALGGVGAGALDAPAALNLSFVQLLAAYRAEAPTRAGRGPVHAVGPRGQLLCHLQPAWPDRGHERRQPDRAADAITAHRPLVAVAPGRLGYTPAQIAQAYGINRTGLSGAGQTIAIISAYNSPTITQDLSVFDQTFGLPNPQLQVVNQNGATPTGPTDSGWAIETALDVEWAHAVAPQANIVVVEADTATVANLASAIGYARQRPSVSVVSMSFGVAEFPQEVSNNSLFTAPPGHQGITFVASSGDSGAGVSWPSASPNVLAVGGTTLLTGPSGVYAGEIGWSQSGGGISAYETEPTYQLGVQLTGRRSTPDVAYDANPQTGVEVYQGGSWQVVGGTSVAPRSGPPSSPSPTRTGRSTACPRSTRPKTRSTISRPATSTRCSSATTAFPPASATTSSPASAPRSPTAWCPTWPCPS